jgi:tripartite-type tricarboxylate transporter receptor subunit TctC
MGVTQLAGAQSRDYPTRPVRIIVPTSPGGILDFVIRTMAPRLTESLGQSVVVENRAGASTNMGSEYAARAPADGYTLLANSQPLVVNPSLFARMAFDVQRDLAPISQLTAASYVLVVHPSLPVKSVRELLTLAKTRPGSINYASGGMGTNLHIAIELLAQSAGLKFTHVPYKGGGMALAATVAGETSLTFPSLAQGLPQVNAGRLRALAMNGRKRSPIAPNLPTITESGVPGYEFSAWVGLLAPSGTPTVVIDKLHRSAVNALRESDVVKRLTADGNDIIASTPAAYAALIETELSRWAKVIRDAGIRPE